MPAAPPSFSFDGSLPFKYIGGDPSVDFVNTVDWTGRGTNADRLSDYARLMEWAEGAELISKTAADRLRGGALSRPEEAAAAMEKARWLRWVLRRVFQGAEQGAIDPAALGEFNDVLTESVRNLYLGRRTGDSSVRFLWRGMGAPLDSILWPVAWAASNLLISGEASELRSCGAEDCGWMYVDRSRNHLRRWCEMETCGTRAKSRRRAERSRSSPVPRG